MLNQLLGSEAKGLFAVALLASGQSSTITGTYAGQYVMDGFLKLRVHPGLRAFLTRACAIVPSLTVVLIAGDEDAETLIVVSSAILSIQLPSLFFSILFLVFLVQLDCHADGIRCCESIGRSFTIPIDFTDIVSV